MSPMIAAQSPDAPLLRSIETTYRALRYGLAVAALGLPPVLYFGEGAIQTSLSAYYYTSMRDVFVGILFGAGAALGIYKRFSKAEDWALNFAGLFAALVALVPTPQTGRFSLHGTFAVLFFLFLAYVAITRAHDTLDLLNDEKKVNTIAAPTRFLAGQWCCAPPLLQLWAYGRPQSARKDHSCFLPRPER